MAASLADTCHLLMVMFLREKWHLQYFRVNSKYFLQQVKVADTAKPLIDGVS